MPYLAVVDRGYRGTAESQHFDALYGILALGGQLGGMDVVLRGTAVTAAVAQGADNRPELRVGCLVVKTLADPRRSVQAMLKQGISVYVDRPALAGFGLDEAALLPGVHCLDTSQLARRWGQYEGVWFL
jgi:intracellular sulfur oxidation DsrE/DsrF family protein